MDNKQQKSLLAFLRKVKDARANQQALEKAIKEKRPGDARSLQNKLTLLNMEIDSDMELQIAVCRVDQQSLF